jgi:hypothetical protein
VQLVTYPPGDGAFAAHAAVHVTIELPVEYSVGDVLAAVEALLRDKYPQAEIHVDHVAGEEFEATWHIYRDGIPTDAHRPN